jgi:hypothetical protein
LLIADPTRYRAGETATQEGVRMSRVIKAFVGRTVDVLGVAAIVTVLGAIGLSGTAGAVPTA